MSNVQFQFIDNSGSVLQALDGNIDRTLEMLGLQAAGYAILNLENEPRRVDTGLLRNSIAYAIAGQAPEVVKEGQKSGQEYQSNSKDKNKKPIPITTGKYEGVMAKSENEHSVYVGSNVEYAEYVEYGVTFASGKVMEANHFLKKAVNDHKDEYKRMIEQGLKGEL